MKFGTETISLLKNFASINTNIVFKAGDTVSTISNARNIFAKATIKEIIPNEFAIYELNSMLSMITLMDNQDIDFGDKCLMVTSPAGKFEYYYSNPEVVTAAAITGAPTISVTCKEQAVTLSVSDRKNDTAANFRKQLGTSLDSFDVYIAVENLKVIPDAYEVSVAKTPNGKAKFLHFKHESRQLQYWIAAEPGSTV